MKNFKIISYVIILFIVIFLGIKTFRNFNLSRYLKKEEKNRLKESAEILNKFFDLENKNKRSTNESMKLIEYCLNKFGSGN